MKKYKEQPEDFSTYVHRTIGRICLAIGRGDLESEVSCILFDAMNRGKENVQKQ